MPARLNKHRDIGCEFNFSMRISSDGYYEKHPLNWGFGSRNRNIIQHIIFLKLQEQSLIEVF